MNLEQSLFTIADRLRLLTEAVLKLSERVVEDVAAPTFSFSNNSVSISCATQGAAIYYTTDGKKPTTKSSLYSQAIAITQKTTIKAVAVLLNKDDSVIVEKEFTPVVAAPSVSGASNVVTMASATSGAAIRYTTDGSVPTESSTLYDDSNKPTISADTTFKAIAIKAGWTASSVTTQTVTYVEPVTEG